MQVIFGSLHQILNSAGYGHTSQEQKCFYSTGFIQKHWKLVQQYQLYPTMFMTRFYVQYKYI